MTEDDFFQAWVNLIGDPTETMALAKKLTRSLPVWLVSNTNPRHIGYGNSQGYFDEFSGKTYSFEIGVRKPSPEFFRTALERSGFEAGSSVLIDDQIKNIEAARALGFETIHYRSDGQVRRDLGTCCL